MKKFISFILILSIMLTGILPFSVSKSYASSGSTSVTSAQRNALFIFSGNGKSISSPAYYANSGNGVDDVLYCLMYGTLSPPKNSASTLETPFKWDPHGQLKTDKDGKPLIDTSHLPRIGGGYSLTKDDIYGLLSLIQKGNEVPSKYPSISYAESSYITQVAMRAYIQEISRYHKGTLNVTFKGSRGYDSAGRMYIGTVKAKSKWYNNHLNISKALYDEAIWYKNKGEVYSNTKLKADVKDIDKTNEKYATFEMNVNMQSASPKDTWAFTKESIGKLKYYGAEIIEPMEFKTLSHSTEFSNSVKKVLFKIPRDKISTSGMPEAGKLHELEIYTKTNVAPISSYFIAIPRGNYQVLFGKVGQNKEDVHKKVYLENTDVFPKKQEIVFPDLTAGATKEDLEGGLDDNNHSPRGDASLSATFTLRAVSDKNGEFFTETLTADDSGQGASFSKITPWKTKDDLFVRTWKTKKNIGTATKPKWKDINHYEYTDRVTITISETEPLGYLSEPESGTGTGERTYSFRFKAYINDEMTDYDYEKSGDGSFSGDTFIFNHATFTNRVKKGTVQLIKYYEKDLDPFSNVPTLKEYVAGAKFTINLISKGKEGAGGIVRVVKMKETDPGYDPFATCYRVTSDSSGIAVTETNPLITSEKGQIKIFGLPFGEYSYKEIGMPKNGYDMVNGSFVIDKDSVVTKKIYSYNLLDKVARDKIKIVKIDSSSLKTIPSKNTAFRIRYMGNPNTLDSGGDVTKDPNYERYLTNTLNFTGAGSNIFYTDSYGQILLPYKLPFGLYRLEEIKPPKGYYIGSFKNDDGVGKTTDDEQNYLNTVRIYDSLNNHLSYTVDINNLPFVIHDFSVRESHENEIIIKVKNNSVMGRIEIFKLAEELVGYLKKNTEYGQVYEPVYEDFKKAGIDFDIYAKSDIKIPDGYDAPTFLDKDMKEVVLDNKISTHAWESDKKELDEKILKDGTRFVIEKNRNTNIKDGKIEAKIITPKSKTNKYKLSFNKKDEEDNDITHFYDYEISMDKTPDGIGILGIKGKKETVSNKALSKMPKFDEVKVMTGSEKADGKNSLIFTNLNELEKELYKEEIFEKNTPKKVLAKEETYIVPKEIEYLPKEEIDKIYAMPEADKQKELKKLIPTDYERVESVTDKFLIKHKTKNEYMVIDKDKNRVLCSEKAIAYKNLPDFDKNIYSLSELAISKDNKFLIINKNDGNDRRIAVVENALNVFKPCDKDGCIYKREPAPISDYALLDSLLPLLVYEYKGSEPDKNEAFKVKTLSGLLPCDKNGKFYDRKVQEFSYTLYQRNSENMSFNFDDLLISMDRDKKDTKISITKPKKARDVEPVLELSSLTEKEENDLTTSFYIKDIEPQGYFRLKDKTVVGTSYNAGYTFAKIMIPKDVPVPHLKVNDVEIDVSKTETDINISPKNPKITVLDDTGMGIRINHELLSPNSDKNTHEGHIITVATKSTSENSIVFTMSDGRELKFSVKNAGDEKYGVCTITSPIKTYKYVLGEKVETVKTDSEGKATSKLLPLGEYVIREKESKGLASLVTSDKDYFVSLDYEGQFVPLVWKKTSVRNNALMMELNLNKVFETAYKSGIYEKKKGAVFGLYAYEDIKAVKPANKKEIHDTIMKKDSLLDIFEISEDGYISKKIKAPFGKYYVKELKTLSGYNLNTAILPFTFKEADADLLKATSFKVKEKGIKGSIKKLKDETEIKLSILRQNPGTYIKVSDYSFNSNDISYKKDLEKGLTISNDLKDDISLFTIKLEKGHSTALDFGDDKKFKILSNELGYKVWDIENITFEKGIDTEIKGGEVIYQPSVLNTGYTYRASVPLDTERAFIENDKYRVKYFLKDNYGKESIKIYYTNSIKEEIIGDKNSYKKEEVIIDAKKYNLLNIDVKKLSEITFKLKTGEKLVIKKDGEKISISSNIRENVRFASEKGVYLDDGLLNDGSFLKRTINTTSLTYQLRKYRLYSLSKDVNLLAKLSPDLSSLDLKLSKMPDSLFKNKEKIENVDALTLKRGDKIVAVTDKLEALEVDFTSNDLSLSVYGLKEGDIIENDRAYIINLNDNSMQKKDGSLLKTIPAMRTEAKDGCTIYYYENKVYKRSSSFNDSLKININSVSDFTGNIINEPVKPPKNEEVPPPPYIPPSPDTYISVLKVDADTKEPLEGVELAILNEKGEIIHKAITDNSGRITFKRPKPGEYLIKELKQKDGYKIQNDLFTFKVLKNGKIEGGLVITNSKTKVYLTKLSTDNKLLKDALISVMNEKGEEITRAKTNEYGNVLLTGLKSGTYYFKELKAPLGYKLNDKVYSFRILTDGSVIGQTSIYNEEKVGEIVLSYEKDKKDGFGEVEFEIIKSDDKYYGKILKPKTGLDSLKSNIAFNIAIYIGLVTLAFFVFHLQKKFIKKREDI